MINFNVLTLFPNLFEPFACTGVIGKAFASQQARLNLINPRDFASDKHKSVDSPPYGGGDGMLLKTEPMSRALESLSLQSTMVVNLSPQGVKWTNALAKQWASDYTDVTLICGRYAGVDQRIINTFVDIEISIGDFVISGGEVASQVIMDSIIRHIPGVLGHKKSAHNDTFSNNLLEPPQFTQPQESLGQTVPEVLVSGHHKNIDLWHFYVSHVITFLRRKDLYDSLDRDPKKLQQGFSYLAKSTNEELLAIGFNAEELTLIRSRGEAE